METTVINATEYRDVPLSLLNESKTNPRHIFEDAALKELADSIRSQGVLSPLLVRPLTENGFEIVFGARRYRAAQLAEQESLPVRIKHMTDAEVIEAQLVENLIRAEIHPMEEAEGFAALLRLEEPKYTIEQIAARVGKSPAFIAQRLKLTDLAPAVVEAFYANDIGVGHALLIAKLPADVQPQALSACFKEVYSGNSQKPARILLPVRNLQFWIESNVLLVLKDAPFDKRDAELLPSAGSCADCPKRTGHNRLLFGDDLGKQGDRCTDPGCYQSKLAAHVAKTVAAKPEIVQISTAYGGQKEGSPVLPRSKYTAIRDDKPKSKDDAKRPEFKACKFTAEAIITEGTDVGTIHKVCANPACPVHHPKQQTGRGASDGQFKAEQESGAERKPSSRAALSANYLADETAYGRRWIFQDVHAGGAAAIAGIEPGNILLRVDGREIVPPEHPVFPMGQQTTLEFVANDDRQKTVSVDVARPKGKKLHFIEPTLVDARHLMEGLGYVKIAMFPGTVGVVVANQISDAVARLGNIDRLIIDLRGNTGGGVGALRVMGLLTPGRVPVGFALDRRRSKPALGTEKLSFPRFSRIPRTPRALWVLGLRYAPAMLSKKPIVLETEGLGQMPFHGRVTLLVDRHTASAAEMIVAFARENNLATIVGEKTAGRLLSATSVKVGKGFRLALPTGAYYTWGGSVLEGTPIVPDRAIDFDWLDRRLQGKDRQLDYAIDSLRDSATARAS